MYLKLYNAMNKLIYVFIFIISLLFFNGCQKGNDFSCDLICESGYMLDENNDQICECADYREKYIGQWEFTKYWGVTHPYEPNSGDETWVGEITYGNTDSTLFIPNNPILEGSEYCFCYEFKVNLLGDFDDDSHDANSFNYYFDGSLTEDSLYYTGTEGSPFSTTSITVYGKKIN